MIDLEILMNQEPVKKNRPPCPSCGSKQILKNGSTHHKKPKFLCKNCGRQFIENPQKKWVSKSTQEQVNGNGTEIY